MRCHWELHLWDAARPLQSAAWHTHSREMGHCTGARQTHGREFLCCIGVECAHMPRRRGLLDSLEPGTDRGWIRSSRAFGRVFGKCNFALAGSCIALAVYAHDHPRVRKALLSPAHHAKTLCCCRVNDVDAAGNCASDSSADAAKKKLLADENRARVSYYLQRAEKLLKEARALVDSGEGDGYVPLWLMANQINAIVQLEPDSELACKLAGELIAKLARSNMQFDLLEAEGGAWANAAAFFEVAVALSHDAESARSDMFKSMQGSPFRTESNQKVTNFVLQLLRTKTNSPQRFCGPDALSSESDECHDAKQQVPVSAGQIQLQSFDLWATHMARANLMKQTVRTGPDVRASLGGMSPEENTLISDKAVSEYRRFKMAAERVYNRALDPAELGNGFFAHWKCNISTILPANSAAHAAYVKLGSLVKSACEDYVRMHARRGSLEAMPLWATPEHFMWAAVYERGTRHLHHIHQASLVSAVYYARVPSGSGHGCPTPIIFSDPRGASPNEDYEAVNKSYREHDFEPDGPFHHQFSYFPREGELIIFPSWLVHKVPAHQDDDERVAFPFNWQTSNFDAWAATAW
eukprot:TRINITY_DN31426_c0_g1_i1.p1 TRINITY_DN31426_c0_g1~~TRINITY_DN31426_c0_g1_i1.p1  ORF type:complete len:580 (+),score=76.98 TRINITY_DN31426_c0_g1_i1:163-1902(+)